jgi:hypothetical protein
MIAKKKVWTMKQGSVVERSVQVSPVMYSISLISATQQIPALFTPSFHFLHLGT